MSKNPTLPKHVVKRRNAFRYRRRVPDDVKSAVGKSEWVAGLGTNLKSALATARILTTKHDRLIFETRQADASIAAIRQISKLNDPATALISEIVARDQQWYPIASYDQQNAALKLFLTAHGDLPLNMIRKHHVRELIAICQANGNRNSTIQRRMNAMCGIMGRYLEDEDIVRRNPFSKLGIKGARANKRDKEPFSKHQLDEMHAHNIINLDNEESPWTMAVFWMCRCSTLGIKEAAGLAEEDIVLDHAVPHVIVRTNRFRDLKTPSRERFFPLAGEAFWRAKHLAAVNPVDSKRMSNKLNRLLRKTTTDRSPKQTFNSFRHNWRDWLIQAGASTEELKYLMGHTNHDITENYGTSEADLVRLQSLVQCVLTELHVQSIFA